MSNSTVSGVLIGLVDTGDGYKIGFSVGGETVVLHPGQAASVADMIEVLLEGLGFYGSEEIDLDSGDKQETLQ